MNAAAPSTDRTPRFRRAGRLAPALARVAATALAGGLLCAVMVRFSPGFGLDEKQLDARLSAESQEAIRRSHDAERSPLRFSAAYLKRALTGDLGFSASLGRPIRELLAERAPATIDLMFWGMAGAWLLAAGLAVPPLAGRLPRLGVVADALGALPAALPAAAIAVLLFRFGASAGWTIALVLFPKLYQYLRNVLAQGYGMPYVLLARAKGLSASRILLCHVLLPARGQLVALAAVSLNMAFGAAVAVEAICDLPGLGQLAWKAALARDLPVLVVLTVLIAIATQVANLLSDAAGPALRSQS
jgi:peptide/nickel transport system permease protein